MRPSVTAIATAWLDGSVAEDLDPLALPGAAPLRMADSVSERRDALRNRERVLCAAQRLLGDSGVGGVDIREVAREAGVGVGTVYRRFGDKAGLVAALLDERERAFQERLLRGPAPLGPGAPPRERLVAFLHDLSQLVEENLPILAMLHGAGPGVRFRVGAYRAWRLHVTILLQDAAPGIDAGWFAEMLLAPLAADLYRHQRYELGIAPERLRQNLEDAVDAVLQAPRRGEALAGD